MKYRRETVSQITLTTTDKCFHKQSKYFYGMLTGLLPEILRDKCCLLSLPVFDWFSTVNTGQPIPTYADLCRFCGTPAPEGLAPSCTNAGIRQFSIRSLLKDLHQLVANEFHILMARL